MVISQYVGTFYGRITIYGYMLWSYHLMQVSSLWSAGHYSEKVDIYALGVMAMEMCGVKPLDHHVNRTTLFTAEKDKASIIAGVEFGRVLCTTWNTDPAVRPGAAALLGALDGDFSQVM